MKIFWLSLGALALLSWPAAGQLASTAAARPMAAAPTRPATALTADEQLFTTLIGQVSAALEKSDMSALGKYMAPEYVHYTPDNTSGGRTEELAHLGTWTGMSVKLRGPVKVNRYGNTAITVSTSTFSGTAEGHPFTSTIQMMTAWVLREGKWQMVVVQSKPVPA